MRLTQVIQSEFLPLYDPSIPLETFISKSRADLVRTWLEDVTLEAFQDNEDCFTSPPCSSTGGYCKPTVDEEAATVTYNCTADGAAVTTPAGVKWVLWVWGAYYNKDKNNRTDRAYDQYHDRFDIYIDGNLTYPDQLCQGR